MLSGQTKGKSEDFAMGEMEGKCFSGFLKVAPWILILVLQHPAKNSTGWLYRQCLV